MSQNARKLKPIPSNNQRGNIWSSSIRDIIGDRRFNDQFNNVNANQTKGTKKVKRTKVGDGETHNLPISGRNASSNQSETTGDPRGCGDFAAKTAEYAFFKRMKENTCSNEHVHPNDHDNRLSNAQHNHYFTREEIPSVQKESIEHVRSSLPSEKEQNYTNYSYLSPPCCGTKKSVIDNVYGFNGTNAQNVRPGEYNWLSPSVGTKIKTSVNKGVFSAKREKLRCLAADRSLYNIDELSSEGFDLVSALISRILPTVQDNNSHIDPNQDETDSKKKLPPFSELESATHVMSHADYERKSTESQNVSYLDYDFFRPTKKPMDKNLLEWNPTGSESFSCDHSSNICQTEGCKREFIKSHHISYLDDCFSGSTKKPIDMDIMEWNPTGLESRIQYNHHRPAGGFKIQNFDMERFLSFDERLPMQESRNFPELDESHLYYEPKLLEQPQTFLLGWDHNTENDESFITSSSTSSHSSPYITRYLKKQHLLTSSISPSTPKHVMAVEDKFPLQDYNTWHVNEFLNEKEHRSESFLYLIQSPADKSLSLLNTDLHSRATVDEDEDSFVYRSGRFLKGRVNDYSSFSYIESFLSQDFDHTDYPLLLHDSSRKDEF